ncbi:hypothetical protein MUU74_09420 [Chryseobacterium daecheongense]|uniref:PglD-related sugar-binding protein n=1 Tax=Chryseobacterium daecheongense TaxID=192389 RepID=UPI002055A513|nr:hypothetical protein [Chryseobacterium daecheongense]UOU96716.1 hypothetical protein MUU74_09420 [Chryseobacterium daecheongense]
MYLYGASGHGKVVAEIAEENKYCIEAFIDADVSKKNYWGTQLSMKSLKEI